MIVRVKKQVVYVFEPDESVDPESRRDAVEETVIALEGERPEIIETKKGEIIAIVSLEDESNFLGEDCYEVLSAMLRDRESEINRVQSILDEAQKAED